MAIFLKLGGSLVTDKTRAETPRLPVIRRLAQEIRAALDARPDLRLLLGHGSGSFGHYAAERTSLLEREGFDPEAYAEVGAAAARLNRIVTDICVAEKVPAVSLPPSVSARCNDGRLQYLATAPVETLLAGGAVPLVYGDVALDDVRGAAIVSTEDVFVYLTSTLQPARIILAGEVDGVFTADPTRDPSAQPISEITPETFPAAARALSGSAGYDVTGGMVSKVRTMIDLVEAYPQTEVYVISGVKAGRVQSALTTKQPQGGTVIRAWPANSQAIANMTTRNPARTACTPTF